MAVARNVVLSRTFGRLCKLKTVNRALATQQGRILSSGFPDEEVPRLCVDEFVLQNAHRWGNKIAMECGITGRKYTYDEIIKKSTNLSRALRLKFKLKKGDVIACVAPNIPEYGLIILAAVKAGLVLTTLNPLYRADEISKQFVDSNIQAIVTTNELCQMVNVASKALKRPIPIVTVTTQKGDPTPEGAVNFAELTEYALQTDDDPIRDPEDLAFLPYSSGTTGLPKGVELNHRNIVSNLQQFMHPSLLNFHPTTETNQDVLPGVLPMFHIYGLVYSCLNIMCAGGKMVTLPKFTPDSFIHLLEHHKSNVLHVAPPLVLFLTTHPGVKRDHMTSVRTLFSGAAPLGASDEANFAEKFKLPIAILQGYGTTETSPAIALMGETLKNELRVSGSVGKPVINTLVKIAPVDDPRGPPLPPGENGEVLVKGPQVMRRYLNRPEETAKTFVDGWLRTGDLAHYDENGLLYLTDRMKELIKVKGFQVAPAELEALIRSYPDVTDAAVVGVPHPRYGEVPKAFVVTKDGEKVDVEKLQEFVSGKVAEFKRLRGGVDVVDYIPKSAAGKILRRQLKEQYC